MWVAWITHVWLATWVEVRHFLLNVLVDLPVWFLAVVVVEVCISGRLHVQVGRLFLLEFGRVSVELAFYFVYGLVHLLQLILEFQKVNRLQVDPWLLVVWLTFKERTFGGYHVLVALCYVRWVFGWVTSLLTTIQRRYYLACWISQVLLATLSHDISFLRRADPLTLLDIAGSDIAVVLVLVWFERFL